MSLQTMQYLSDLDFLFNETDQSVTDDTFINFTNTEDSLLQLFESSGSDDLFSNAVSDDFELSSKSPSSEYSMTTSSPGSGSYISDGLDWPHSLCKSQPEYIPQSINESEVSLESAYMSSFLIGSDMMLMDSNCDDAPTKTVDCDLDIKNCSLPVTIQDIKVLSAETSTKTISTTNSIYPRLRLTDEEKRLLVEMNADLPTDMPLTKDEERLLKTVRRKIRNKISAMDSRKKKKVYIDNLEERVHHCTKQNIEMQKKMVKLEGQNKSLMQQLKNLQCLVSKSTSKATQAGTCVMVLLFSFALLIAPSINPFTSPRDGGSGSQYQPSGVVSRTLKHSDMGTAQPFSYPTDQTALDSKQPSYTFVEINNAQLPGSKAYDENTKSWPSDDQDTLAVPSNESSNGRHIDGVNGTDTSQTPFSDEQRTNPRHIIHKAPNHGDEM